MPEAFPIPLGARKARREHGQILVSLPHALRARWAVGDNTLFYWSLIDDHVAALTKLEAPPPGRPLPDHDPRRAEPHADQSGA